MKRCKICVLPETFPGIEFDENGICFMCNESKSSSNGTAINTLEDKYLNKVNKVINNAKGENYKYHAAVAYSGGKDSTYLIYILKKIYKLNVLAVTFDNGYISRSANENIEAIVKNLDVDHITVRYNHSVVSAIIKNSVGNDIYPANLIKCGSGVCISCIRMVNNMVLRIAIEKGIPMVMLGNSPGQLVQTKNELMFKDNFIPYEVRRSLYKSLADKAGEDIYYYMMLTEEEYRTKLFPYTINLLAMINYNEQEIYSIIQELGWKKPKDVDLNSTNCRLNSFGIVKHKEIYHFHPYDYEMSMLVRLGKLTREEALRRVEDPEGIVEKIAKNIEADFC